MATNRRRKGVQCRVVCAPLVGEDLEEPQGVIGIVKEVGTAD
ncbi:MAG: hypothetical protein ABR499_10950 [Gemmatimonadaceae bacterium]